MLSSWRGGVRGGTVGQNVPQQVIGHGIYISISMVQYVKCRGA